MRTLSLLSLLLFLLNPLCAQNPGGFSNVWLHFPDDVRWTHCDETFDFGAVELYNPDSLNIAVMCDLEIIDPVPEVCFIQVRRWMVFNADTYDTQLPCVHVPNPNPSPILNHPSNLPAPIVSPEGTPAPWTPTVVNLYPGAPAPTQFSTFWSATANCYIYKQNIKILDTQDPVVENCPAVPPFFDDSTANAPELWNAPYWNDLVLNTNDLNESAADLGITALDSCSSSNVDIRYLLFLDLNRDGTLETVVYSGNLPPANIVYYGNAANPNFGGGEARAFDQRAVPDSAKYRFAMQTTIAGTHRTASVRWNTLAAPNSFVLPELPAAAHKIRWLVSDACGNEAMCEHPFTVLSNVVGTAAPGSEQGFVLFQNSPNPFSDETSVRFQLSKAGEVVLQIHDLTSRLLWEQSRRYAAGEHSVKINRAELPTGAGPLHCSLLTNNGLATMKMLLVD